MKRRAILAIVAATLLTTSIGFTAPLTDYSTGKTGIDLTWRNAENNTKTVGNEISFGKKNSLDWGITTGVGNNFAIQYNGYNAKSKDTVTYRDTFEIETLNLELKTQEFNVLYKLDNNVSVYTGIVSFKGSGSENKNVSGVNTSYNFESDTKKKIQLGLVGSAKIADKTTAYALIGVAADYTNWKIGLSQEIAPNLELNVDYRNMQAKKMTFNNGASYSDVDITAKGLGFGISYKF